MLNSRLSRLDQLMASNHFDAIVLNPGPSLVYLTGLHFHLMERPTLFLYKRGESPRAILPELEAGKLEKISTAIIVNTFGDDPASWQSVINQALEGWLKPGQSLGVEPTRLRFLEMDYLSKALPDVKFLPAETVIGALRLQKDDEEIECMRKAVKIAQNALKATLPLMKSGVSEQEIASELVIQLFKAGSSTELPFAPIVASGPNSANPHAVPTDRKIKKGDLVVIDWGAAYDDYFSDLTRTFSVGEISPELVKIYEVVKSANAAGREAGKPEHPAGEVDAAARTVIEAAGYGEFFTHRTGHGLGMEAHEQPYMFAGNPLVLKKGMVYTVEPGIYLPGKGGVRIEDNVVISEDGSECLSDFPRELKKL
jgi:Xaa-Pro dipeptidase